MAGIVALIDYGSGNLTSAAKALARAAREAGTGQTIVVTHEPEIVSRAEQIVLPGVGAFGDCKRGLAALTGMQEVLTDAVRRRGVPFLGICVGMQLMARQGLEHGTHEGFGWIDGEVDRLEPSDPALKIPHMGWNEVRQTASHSLTEGLPDLGHAYFVHSYAFSSVPGEQILATCDYDAPFPAIVGRDNWVGTQFHPEKSQSFGLGLLANFLTWNP
jgi:glutamine amidotransferase